jgi:serine/threonine-protein kinase RsbW
VNAARSFRRSIDALPEIVDFTAGAFAAQAIDPALRGAVDFGLEELFTNMVKYGDGDAEVRIEIDRIEGGVEVTLIDYDVDPFDVTAAPDADTAAPLEARRPGGLGLHLVRRLVDSIAYDYSVEQRQSRIRFRKLVAPRSGTAAEKGKDHAGD